MSRGARKGRGSPSIRQLAESRLKRESAVDLAELTPDEIRRLVHELEVHRVELELQNQQLEESQLEVEESREEYRLLYELAPIGYLTLDSGGAIVAANLSASELLGTPRGQILGRTLSSFVAADDQDRWHFAKRVLLEKGERVSFEIAVTRHGGSDLEMQLVGAGRTGVAGKVNVALLDVSELRNTEASLRRAATSATLAEHQERRKLASDLHDDAGQLLSLASIKLHALANAVTPDKKAQVREVAEILAETRRRVTSLTFQLSPPLLHDVGLVAAVRWLGDDLEHRYGLTVTVAESDELPLEEATRVTLFRAIRELLINVSKHARVNRASVRIWGDGVQASVAVEDEGIGFTPGAITSGFGILALRERVGQLGGTLRIESDPRGVGSRIVVSVPLKLGREIGQGDST